MAKMVLGTGFSVPVGSATNSFIVKFDLFKTLNNGWQARATCPPERQTARRTVSSRPGCAVDSSWRIDSLLLGQLGGWDLHRVELVGTGLDGDLVLAVQVALALMQTRKVCSPQAGSRS